MAEIRIDRRLSYAEQLVLVEIVEAIAEQIGYRRLNLLRDCLRARASLEEAGEAYRRLAAALHKSIDDHLAEIGA